MIIKRPVEKGVGGPLPPFHGYRVVGVTLTPVQKAARSDHVGVINVTPKT